MKGVVSTAGAGTLALARKLRPHAITLDLGLDDINGFVLLDLLKHDPETGQIPIHVISGADEVAYVTEIGAYGVTGKPADHGELAKLFGRIAGAGEEGPPPAGRAARRPRRAKPAICPSLPARRC